MRSLVKNNASLGQFRAARLESRILASTHRRQTVYSVATETGTTHQSRSIPPTSLLESSVKSSSSGSTLLNWRLQQKQNDTGGVKFEGETSWSSPNDLISRNSFAKNHIHLWTLLEACIESGNMTRAESVLIGLSEIANSSDVTLAVNNYLNKLVQLNAGNSSVGLQWIKKIRNKISKFEPNTVTDAIILKSIYSSHDTDKLREFVVSKRGTLGEILSHVEVLGLGAMVNIVKVSIVFEGRPDVV
ncbi:hypothetical protein AWJ20_1927 [Sugiyamaella lignohabitans]|uniref:Uncharacterized protein n=1 Tax=Sugiyamaella lignohabitans TaxID=796027 RepID=A0A167E4G8_9ASCO|nr:uncharacterized protein AWJ20_1927 [Sugiyamaella lignohabitans]ANB13628.1 hypothetical protein AWJ20_1927 [Sugiyamaella lignohabitans]